MQIYANLQVEQPLYAGRTKP